MLKFQREKQINQLFQQLPSVVSRNENRSILEVGLKMSSTGKVLVLRVELPEEFPNIPPNLKISCIGNNVFHPWLVSGGQVVGLKDLYSWNAETHTLYAAVQQVISEFSLNPPRLVATSQPPPAYNASSSSSSTNGGNGPSSQVIKQQQKPIKENQQVEDDGEVILPPIPSEFQELNDLDAAELQRLLDRDDLFFNFFNSLDLVQNLNQLITSIQSGNFQNATENLKKKEEMEILISKINSREEKIADAIEIYNLLESEKAKSMIKFSSTELKLQFKKLADQADEQCEQYAVDLEKEEVGVYCFVCD